MGESSFVIELSRNNIMTPGRVLPWLPLASGRSPLALCRSRAQNVPKRNDREAVSFNTVYVARYTACVARYAVCVTRYAAQVMRYVACVEYHVACVARYIACVGRYVACVVLRGVFAARLAPPAPARSGHPVGCHAARTLR